jgi:hypothetical protein
MASSDVLRVEIYCDGSKAVWPIPATSAYIPRDILDEDVVDGTLGAAAKIAFSVWQLVGHLSSPMSGQRTPQIAVEVYDPRGELVTVDGCEDCGDLVNRILRQMQSPAGSTILPQLVTFEPVWTAEPTAEGILSTFVKRYLGPLCNIINTALSSPDHLLQDFHHDIQGVLTLLVLSNVYQREQSSDAISTTLRSLETVHAVAAIQAVLNIHSDAEHHRKFASFCHKVWLEAIAVKSWFTGSSSTSERLNGKPRFDTPVREHPSLGGHTGLWHTLMHEASAGMHALENGWKKDAVPEFHKIEHEVSQDFHHEVVPEFHKLEHEASHIWHSDVVPEFHRAEQDVARDLRDVRQEASALWKATEQTPSAQALESMEHQGHTISFGVPWQRIPTPDTRAIIPSFQSQG